MRAAVPCLLAVSLGPATGCSLLFVKGPPPREERRGAIHCTPSAVAPAIDTIVAGWQVVRIVLAIMASDSDYARAPVGRAGDIAIGTGLLTLFAGSAAYGMVQSQDCREALGSVDVATPRSRPRPPAPPPWRLGPPPPAQQKIEEQEEEAAVQARAAAMAAEQAKAAGEAARVSGAEQRQGTAATRTRPSP